MADLYNLVEELEDREADLVFPDDDDDDDDDPEGTPPLSRLGRRSNGDGDTPPESDEAETDDVRRNWGREAPPPIPPALADAERWRGEDFTHEEEEEEEDDDNDDDDDDDSDHARGWKGKDASKRHPKGGKGRYYESTNGGDEDEDEDEDLGGGRAADPEFEQLKSIWMQELSCPELLPHDAETVALHLALLRGQEDTIDELREAAGAAGNGDDGRGRGGGGGGGNGTDPMLAHLAAGIYKMEADRVRFLLADLTRTRLAKIERHARHNREMVDRMTEEEVSYLQKYGQLLDRHLRRSVLDHMPAGAWRKLDEPEMIDRPDLDEYVFVRILETVDIDNSIGEEKYGKKGGRDNRYVDDDDEEEEENNVQEFPAGSCLIARYATVREYVLQGKVVLLM